MSDNVYVRIKAEAHFFLFWVALNGLERKENEKDKDKGKRSVSAFIFGIWSFGGDALVF